MASRTGLGRPPLLPNAQTPYTLRLTDITVASYGRYKPSRSIEITIDGRSRNVDLLQKKSDSILQWSLVPNVVISPSTTIEIQPYEARSLIRVRKKAETVTISGDVIARACAKKPGEKLEHVQRSERFRVILGIAQQRIARAVDKMPSEHGDLLFGPPTAPNSFKRSLDAINQLKRVLPPEVISTETWETARAAVKHACEAMPTYDVEDDLQDLGEELCALLLHLQEPESASKLVSQNDTVETALSLIENAAMCAEDYSKPEAKANETMAEQRKSTLEELSHAFAKVERNFDESKNTSFSATIYRRDQNPTAAPSVLAPDIRSEVGSVADSEHETRSVTFEEDDLLGDSLNPQFTPTHLLNLCCLEGTRKYYLDQIIAWFDDEEAPNVLWLCGGPGTGKTTISWNLIAELEKQQRSASEFFFRPGEHSPYMLWRTTAYKLAKFHPALKAAVYTALVEDSAVIHDIKTAFDTLVAKSLATTIDRFKGRGPVILIDGLDHCARSSDWDVLLQTLASWLDLPAQCKLVITSRHADDIAKVFADKDIKRMELPTGDDADSNTDADIRAYLDHRLAEIKAQNSSLPDTWPNPDDVAQLTTHSAGFFLWAKEAVDYVASVPDVEQQLSSVVTGGPGLKLEAIDIYLSGILYNTLGSSPTTGFRALIGAISHAKGPLTMDDIRFLFEDRFTSESIEAICVQTLPLISIGHDARHLSLRHRSIVGFLTDSKRCTDQAFFVDRGKSHRKMAIACLRVMHQGLKFNICDLPSSHGPNEDLANYAERVEKAIPSHLSYACKFWALHLHDVSDKRDNEIGPLLKKFLHEQLLFWLEVLSLIDEVDVAPRTLVAAAEWLESSDKDLAAFALDASRFTLTFREAIAYSVPHIYLSALPFSPPESRVFQQYKDRFPGTFKVTRDSSSSKGWPPMRFAFPTPSFVVNLAMHPDGKRVAVATGESAVHVWNLTTGTSVLKFTGHNDTVRSVAYSPKARRLATAGDDRTIRIWDAETGKLLSGPYEVHSRRIRSIAWSPDGKMIASGSDDRMVIVITADTGVPVFEALPVHTDWVRSVAFTPDGRYVVSGSDDTTTLIWNVSTGSVVGDPLRGHTGYIRCVTVSPDGKRLASGGDDSSIMMYDMETKARIGQFLRGHIGSVRGLTFSKDSKLLASCSDDWKICIWNVETGRRHCDALQGHTGYVSTIAFSPDMKQIVSGEENNVIRIWDMDALPMWRPDVESTAAFQTVTPMADGKTILSSDGSHIWKWQVDSGEVQSTSFESSTEPIATTNHLAGIRSTAFSADGTRIATGGEDRAVYVWDTDTGKALLGPLEGHTDTIYSVAFSLDGKQIVSGSDDTRVFVWNAETGATVCGPLQGPHGSNVRAVCFSPDGKQVASASHDRSMVIWSIETGEPVFPTMRQHSDWVNAVAYSPNGRYLASASDDNTTLIWDVETGQVVFQPLRGHTYYLRAVAWSHDSTKIVSGGLDKDIFVFDVETGAVICGPLHGHAEYIYSVAFSPDDNKVISAAGDGTIRIWDISSRSFSQPASFNVHGDWVHTVSLSPDGSYVASGGDDCNVLVQDVSTGIERFPVLQGHRDWVRGLSYSFDGEVLASCSDDGTIRLWNTRTGESISDPFKGHAGSVRAISFAPDSKLLVSGGKDKTVRIWNTERPAESAFVQVIGRHSKVVTCVAFSPDGRHVVSGSTSGDIAMHDVGFVIYPSNTVFRGEGSVSCVAFFQDGSRVVSAGTGPTLRVWDMETGNALLSIPKLHTGPVPSISVSPDCRYIISAGDDATIRMWDASTGAAQAVPLRGHQRKVLSIAISRDGHRLVSGSADNSVMVWHINLAKPTKWPESYVKQIRGIEFCAVDEGGFFSDSSTIADNGWIRGVQSEPLLWVPPMARQGLWMPHTAGIMGAQETMIDFRQYMHGDGWVGCKAGSSEEIVG